MSCLLPKIDIWVPIRSAYSLTSYQSTFIFFRIYLRFPDRNLRLSIGDSISDNNRDFRAVVKFNEASSWANFFDIIVAEIACHK